MFDSRSNDPILQARSRENKVLILFIHPAGLLVAGTDGLILDRTLLGNRLLIDAEDAKTEKDQNRVFTFDLPVRWR